MNKIGLTMEDIKRMKIKNWRDKDWDEYEINISCIVYPGGSCELINDKTCPDDELIGNQKKKGSCGDCYFFMGININTENGCCWYKKLLKEEENL